jgi:hypothetical protein
MGRKNKTSRLEYEGFIIQELPSGNFAVRLRQYDLFGEAYICDFKPRTKTLEEAKQVINRLRQKLIN